MAKDFEQLVRSRAIEARQSFVPGHANIGAVPESAVQGLSRSSVNLNSGMNIPVQEMVPVLPGAKLCALTICWRWPTAAPSVKMLGPRPR